jgi:hypothetical protein
LRGWHLLVVAADPEGLRDEMILKIETDGLKSDAQAKVRHVALPAHSRILRSPSEFRHAKSDEFLRSRWLQSDVGASNRIVHSFRTS